MKLKGRIYLEQDKSLRFESTIYDGTPFSLVVDQFDVQFGGSFKPSKMYVDGHLFVTCEAQQGDVCYLTLPKPTINFGKQVTVKEYLLMPRDVKIEDFNPQKKEVVKRPDVTAEELADTISAPELDVLDDTLS